MEGVAGAEVDIYLMSFVLMEHFKHTMEAPHSDPQAPAQRSCLFSPSCLSSARTPTPEASQITEQTLRFVSLSDTGSLVIVSFYFI